MRVYINHMLYKIPVSWPYSLHNTTYNIFFNTLSLVRFPPLPLRPLQPPPLFRLPLY